MADILKIAFLVCLTFIFLVPNGVRALICVHCVSKNLNGTDAEECIGKENMKYGSVDCGPAVNNTKICKIIDIGSNGTKDVTRTCVNKPEYRLFPCCAPMVEPTNNETMLAVPPAPYWVCFCDTDNCNNITGDINKDNLPFDFEECRPPGGFFITLPPRQLGIGRNQSGRNSQDYPRVSSLSVLVAVTVCLTAHALKF